MGPVIDLKLQLGPGNGGFRTRGVAFATAYALACVRPQVPRILAAALPIERATANDAAPAETPPEGASRRPKFSVTNAIATTTATTIDRTPVRTRREARDGGAGRFDAPSPSVTINVTSHPVMNNSWRGHSSHDWRPHWKDTNLGSITLRAPSTIFEPPGDSRPSRPMEYEKWTLYASESEPRRQTRAGAFVTSQRLGENWPRRRNCSARHTPSSRESLGRPLGIVNGSAVRPSCASVSAPAATANYQPLRTIRVTLRVPSQRIATSWSGEPCARHVA
jgi:hypothetical protein